MTTTNIRAELGLDEQQYVAFLESTLHAALLIVPHLQDLIDTMEGAESSANPADIINHHAYGYGNQGHLLPVSNLDAANHWFKSKEAQSQVRQDALDKLSMGEIEALGIVINTRESYRLGASSPSPVTPRTAKVRPRTSSQATGELHDSPPANQKTAGRPVKKKPTLPEGFEYEDCEED